MVSVEAIRSAAQVITGAVTFSASTNLPLSRCSSREAAAALCIRALETGLLPPTINLDDPDPECRLDHVVNKARAVRARVALSNSFGFGGTNAALIFGRR